MSYNRNPNDENLKTMKKGCIQDMNQFQNKIEEQYSWTLKPEQGFKMHTTADFFQWMSHIKSLLHEDKDARDRVVKEAIAGNETMELLYAWSDFSRSIDDRRASVYDTIHENSAFGPSYNDEVLAAYQFNPAIIVNTYLAKHLKENQYHLFDAIPSCKLGFDPNFKSFTTPYEFQKMLYTDEIHPYPWGMICLSVLLKAYGITKEDFSHMKDEIKIYGDSLLQEAENAGIIRRKPNEKVKKRDSIQKIS